LPRPSTAEKSAPPTPYRFSLLTLLGFTTLAGFTSAIVFSRHWHPDERLLLAFWCAGLILGVTVGRLRGTQGVISGGLGAVVGCLLAATFLQGAWFGPLPVMQAQPAMTYLAFVICLGWLAATLVALGYRALSSAWLSRNWSRYITRPVLITIVGGAVCLVVASQMLWPRPWLPAWEIANQRDGIPYFTLSPHGDLLYVHYRTLPPSGKPEPDQIFQLTSRGVVARNSPLESDNIAFSPDGKLIAADGIYTCRLFDLETGQALHTWPLRNNERIRQLQFTPSGSQLLMTTMTHKIQRLYVIDVASADLPTPQLFPFVGFLFLDPTGEVLVKLHTSQDETDEQRVEVVSRDDGTVLGQIHDLPALDQLPVFAASGEYLAFDNRVWRRTGGRPSAFVDGVVGLTAGQRAIVLDYAVQDAWEQAVPYWLANMPFVRQLLTGAERGKMQIVDIATGEVRAQAPAYPLLLEAELSSDGKVLASAALDGRIRIWKVPEP
jgi:hypothetical protein